MVIVLTKMCFEKHILIACSSSIAPLVSCTPKEGHKEILSKIITKIKASNERSEGWMDDVV